MDDDGDMAEMYLTEKKLRAEIHYSGPPEVSAFGSLGSFARNSLSAPVSPSTSPKVQPLFAQYSLI